MARGTCGDADMSPPECDSNGDQSASAPIDAWRLGVLVDFRIRRGGSEGGGMSTSADSVSSGDGERLPVAMASFAAPSYFLFSILWAERIAAFLKAAHISSDHDLQVLQGVVRVQKIPTLCIQDLQDG